MHVTHGRSDTFHTLSSKFMDTTRQELNSSTQ